MKKTNAISILCNNVDFLNIIIKNLPKTFFNTTQLIVFTETRIGDKTVKLKKICDKVNGILITDKDVNKEFNKIVNNEFVNNWSFSLNILMHWYIFKFFDFDNVLFCDDDVIIKPEIVNLFNNKTYICAFTLNTIRDFKDDSNDTLLYKIADCFNYEIEVDKWKKYYALGAFIIYNKNDFNVKRYEKGLKKFFSSEYFIEIWKSCRSYRSKNLDERFMTMFILKSKIENNDLTKYISHINSKFEKITDKFLEKQFKDTKYIIHIGNNKGKLMTYNKCIDLGLFKGKKFKIA